MRFTRRRPDRSGPDRRKHVSCPEALESRRVLSGVLPSYLSPWIPSDLPVENPITHQKENLSVAEPQADQHQQSPPVQRG